MSVVASCMWKHVHVSRYGFCSLKTSMFYHHFMNSCCSKPHLICIASKTYFELYPHLLLYFELNGFISSPRISVQLPSVVFIKLSMCSLLNLYSEKILLGWQPSREDVFLTRYCRLELHREKKENRREAANLHSVVDPHKPCEHCSVTLSCNFTSNIHSPG